MSKLSFFLDKLLNWSLFKLRPDGQGKIVPVSKPIAKIELPPATPLFERETCPLITAAALRYSVEEYNHYLTPDGVKFIKQFAQLIENEYFI